MKKLNLLYLLISALIFGACNDDTFGSYGEYSEGRPATLSGSITVPAQQKIQSRAIGQERETAIEQLAIIAWEIKSGRKMSIDLTGKLKGRSWTTNGSSVYDLTGSVDVLTGHYRAYFIANWKSYYGRKDNTAGNELTFADLEKMSEAEIQQIQFWNYGNHIDLYGNDGFPMTQVFDGNNTEGKILEINDGDNKLTGVKLDRASAHIYFKIFNGNDSIEDSNKHVIYTGDNKPNFVPQRFTVYRVPQRTNAFTEGQKAISKDQTFNSEATFIVEHPDNPESGCYEFDFHMLENKQPLATAEIKSIGDRERWDYTATNPEAELGRNASAYADRKFINAPEGATFVVIEGTYTGPAGKADETTKTYSGQVYSGTVSYIIHLGNFNTVGNSPANHPGSLNDFSVLRNELQTYKIHVQSANSIIVNVETQDTQHNPAVEGDLYEQSSTTLDAHYAKIMMRIPISAINATIDDNKVILSTVMNGFASTEYTISQLDNDTSLDYKWIQFQEPTEGTEQFPQYAGVSNHLAYNNENTPSGRYYGYINDLVHDLAAYRTDNTHQLKYAIAVGDYFYTAAFVDENIYSYNRDLTIKQWAGGSVNDRIIALNPSYKNYSPDNMSTLSGAATINIRQKPVSSTYSLDAASVGVSIDEYNPFGLEQIMEPTSTVEQLNKNGQPAGLPIIKDNQLMLIKAAGNEATFASAYYWDTDYNTNNDINNYDVSTTQQNTIRLFPDFDKGVPDDFTSFYKPTTEDKATIYEFDPADDYMTASKGLVVHNRDLNGDGKITSDEIRWYIPGYVQLLIYNFGYNVVKESLRLQSLTEEAAIAANNNLVISNGERKDDLSFPRYLTSSTSDKRLYWQDQRGASSKIGPDPDWASVINRIRFARNLGKFNGATTAPITRMTQKGTKNNSSAPRILHFLNPNITRNYDVTGAYPFHYCTSEYNHLPKALQYSAKTYNLWDNNNNAANNFVGLTKPEQIQEKLYELTLKAYNDEEKTSYTELPDGWRVPNQRELLALFVSGIATTTKSQSFLCCSFINSEIHKNRLLLPVLVVKDFVSLPSNWVQTAALGVILVRDVDPETGNVIATQATTSRIGRGILKR